MTANDIIMAALVASVLLQSLVLSLGIYRGRQRGRAKAAAGNCITLSAYRRTSAFVVIGSGRMHIPGKPNTRKVSRDPLRRVDLEYGRKSSAECSGALVDEVC